jgi:hypothetical protein
MFPIRLGRFYRWLMLPAGITPGNCWLDLRDGRLMARFGLFFKLDVPLSEVEALRFGPTTGGLFG